MQRVLDHAGALLIGGASFAGEVHDTPTTPTFPPSTARATCSCRRPMRKAFQHDPGGHGERAAPAVLPGRGVVDCIRDGDNGVLVEAGDIAALASALDRLLAEADQRDRLAASALAECRRVCSWHAVGRQIMGLCEALRGTTLDRDFNPNLPMSPCRFRAEPHLL